MKEWAKLIGIAIVMLIVEVTILVIIASVDK